MKLQNSSLRKRKGFTLIELIVVIAILAILAAIAIPTFLGTLDRANDRTVLANQRIIASAVSLFLAENGALPANDGNLTQYITGGIAGMQGDPVGSTYTVGYTATAVTIAATSPSGNPITSIVING